MLSYSTEPVNPDSLRMYILVRREILPLVHCMCQSAHAAAEFVEYHRNENTTRWARNDKTMIILEADLASVQRVMKLFADKNMNYQPFFEPDMSNAMTAVAFQPIPTSLGREIFGEFKLLK